MRKFVILILISFIYAYAYQFPKNNWEEIYLKTKDKDTVKALFELTDDYQRIDFDGEKLILTPKPILKKLNIIGNRSFWDSEIIAITGLREGFPVDEDSLENVATRIAQFYKDNGFFSAKATIDYQKQGEDVYITVEIDEGKRSKLLDVVFKSDQIISSSDTLTFKRVLGLKSGKTVKFQQLYDAIEKLRNTLFKLGYYDSSVDLESIEQMQTGYIIPVISINFGTKYIIQFQGNRVFSEEVLKSLLTFEEEGFNYYQLGRSLQNIVEAYLNLGYLAIQVNYEIEYSKERVEDLYPLFTFVNIFINEGGPFYIENFSIDTDFPQIENEISNLLKIKGSYRRGEILNKLNEIVSNFRKNGYLASSFDIEEQVIDTGKLNLRVKLYRREKYILKSVSFKNYRGKSIKVKLPQIYNPDYLLEIQEKLKKKLREDGFFDGDVLMDVSMERVGENIEAHVNYIIEYGVRYKNGFTFVYGSKNTSPTLIKYQFPDEGDFYTEKENNLSLDRLYSSRLFEVVNLYLLEDHQQKVVNKAVILHDDKRGLFQGSLGYTTDQLFRVALLAVFKNLFNYGLEASTYIERSNFQSSYKFSFGSRLLPKAFSSFISAFSNQQYRRFFQLEQEGVEFILEKRHNLWVSSSVVYTNSKNNISKTSIETDDISYGLNKLLFSIVDDHRDSKIDPRDGYLSSLKVESVWSKKNFIKLELAGRHYKSFLDVITFSQRFSTGYIFSSFDKIPLSERYFVGGINSLRGFGLEEVAGEKKLGGNSFLLLNNEIRLLTLRRYNLYTLIFFDVGNVFHDREDFLKMRLRESAGVGIYLPTPVGAIILDVARKLDRRPGEEGYRIEFSIGSSF